MGLDFYPEGPHFSYGGFSYFRNNIAHYFKIPLILDTYTRSSQTGDKRLITFISYDLSQIEFTGKHTFLKLFLSHSDCDGQLTPEECKGISVLMDEYILQLEKDVKKMKSNYHKLFKTKKIMFFILKNMVFLQYSGSNVGITSMKEIPYIKQYVSFFILIILIKFTKHVRNNLL